MNDVPCTQIVSKLHQSSIYMLSHESLLKGYDSFVMNKDIPTAIIYMAKAYSLGNPYAAISLKNLIENDQIGDFYLRRSKEQTSFSLEIYAMIKKSKVTNIGDIADKVYHGVIFGKNILERYKNAYQFYRTCWNQTEDYYCKYSLGYMMEHGEGVENISLKNAMLNYREVAIAGIKGQVSRGVVLPSVLSMAKLTIKRLIIKFQKSIPLFYLNN